jgi:hypothetical protein
VSKERGGRRTPALLALCAALALSAAPAARAVPDYDGDGRVEDDCAPLDPEVFPAAPDRPDLSFEDTNCDGIDGDAARAVFVAPNGSDAGAGTKDSPLLTIGAAVARAAQEGKDVYVAGGTYAERVAAASNVGIYGGYVPFTSNRSPDVTKISGAPEAIVADGDRGVILQMVTLAGSTDSGGSAYGLRAAGGSSVALVRVAVTAAPAAAGQSGATGPGGGPGGAGGNGVSGGCFSSSGAGGSGGSGANAGGNGGNGGFDTGAGQNGFEGAPAGPGGNGGNGGAGTSGGSGTGGASGAQGSAGASGSQGVFSTSAAASTWLAGGTANGGTGAPGSGGAGGGGAGGGGGADDPTSDGRGGGGAGGGGGGFPGGGGAGGRAGGGSFAAYLFDSSVVVDASALAAGDGGSGGDGGTSGAGGNGGFGGLGGAGPLCGAANPGEGGNGGAGGKGGSGGAGGGGAGGPSAGIFSAGQSTFAIRPGTTVQAGTAGEGGRVGGNGPPAQSGQVAATLPLGSDSSAGSDFDSDGVADLGDACPDVPRGASDANGDGCPDRRPKLVDSDGDTVPDGFDPCPATSGGDSDRDLDGCPGGRRIEQLPDPAPFRQANVEPLAGEVLVKVPGGAAATVLRLGGWTRLAQALPGFVPLVQAEQIPMGSTIATTRGKVRVETAANSTGSKTQTGSFFAGLFQLRQPRAARPITEMVLKGGSFRKACRGAAGKGSAGAAARARRVRRLWGDGRGRFRTRGRYSSATVRGTSWLVEDRCDGTLTRVRRGRVLVQDLVRGRRVVLKAPRSYLARPGKR